MFLVKLVKIKLLNKLFIKNMKKITTLLLILSVSFVLAGCAKQEIDTSDSHTLDEPKTSKSKYNTFGELFADLEENYSNVNYKVDFTSGTLNYEMEFWMKGDKFRADSEIENMRTQMYVNKKEQKIDMYMADMDQWMSVAYDESQANIDASGAKNFFPEDTLISGTEVVNGIDCYKIHYLDKEKNGEFTYWFAVSDLFPVKMVIAQKGGSNPMTMIVKDKQVGNVTEEDVTAK